MPSRAWVPGPDRRAALVIIARVSLAYDPRRPEVVLKNGDRQSFTFAIDRAGQITVIEQGKPVSAPRIKKTSDPWGD